MKTEKSLLDYKLKTCPFCGGFAYLTSWPIIGGNLFKAMCEDMSCGAETDAKATPEAAAKVWNHRAKEEDKEGGQK